VLYDYGAPTKYPNGRKIRRVNYDDSQSVLDLCSLWSDKNREQVVRKLDIDRDVV
jgi:hypothetical protein